MSRYLARPRLAPVVALLLAFACTKPESSPIGQLGDKIVGGTDTDERPEIGLMQIDGGYCTATLVARNVIISAAHCVDYSTGDAPSRSTFTVRAADGITHVYGIRRFRAFSTSPGEDDLSILQLASEVEPNVATPTALALSTPPAGERLVLWGYGCRDRDTQSGFGHKQKLIYTYGRTTHNLCPGDSGGPTTIGATGPVLFINSAYTLPDGTDIFGDVVKSWGALDTQLRAWAGQAPRPVDAGVASTDAAGGLDANEPSASDASTNLDASTTLDARTTLDASPAPDAALPDASGPADPCARLPGCDGCTREQSCGWCTDLRRCLTGSTHGAGAAECTFDDWAWVPYQCP